MLSYGGGDAPPAIRELFGVEFLGSAGPRGRLRCHVAQAEALGALVSFDVNLDVADFALLASAPRRSSRRTRKGCPLLTLNQVGQGRAVFVGRSAGARDRSGRPMGDAARRCASFCARYTVRLHAPPGAVRPWRASAHEIELALFQGEAEDVLVLINHASEKVTPALVSDRRVESIADVRGGAHVAVGGTHFSVPLGPNGVVALRLTYA